MQRTLQAALWLWASIEGARAALLCTSLELRNATACGGDVCDALNDTTTKGLALANSGLYYAGEPVATGLNNTGDLCLDDVAFFNSFTKFVCVANGGVATLSGQLCFNATSAPDTPAPAVEEDDGTPAWVPVLIVLLILALLAAAAVVYWKVLRPAPECEAEEDKPRKDGLTAPLFDSVAQMEDNAQKKASAYYYAAPAHERPAPDAAKPHDLSAADNIDFLLP